MKKIQSPQPNGKCFNCGVVVDGDAFCFGCKRHVCDDCDKNWGIDEGGHEPAWHLNNQPITSELKQAWRDRLRSAAEEN